MVDRITLDEIENKEAELSQLRARFLIQQGWEYKGLDTYGKTIRRRGIFATEKQALYLEKWQLA